MLYFVIHFFFPFNSIGHISDTVFDSKTVALLSSALGLPSQASVQSLKSFLGLTPLMSEVSTFMTEIKTGSPNPHFTEI